MSQANNLPRLPNYMNGLNFSMTTKLVLWFVILFKEKKRLNE